MSRIIISTESGSDLPYKITVPHNIQIIPMHVSFGSKTLADTSFDTKEIFDFYRQHKKLPKTSAPNPGDYTLHFKSIFDKYKDCSIIHISYSSKLSVSYQNALLASHSFEDSKISVIDSQNASAGLGVLVMYAAKIISKYNGLFTFDEIVSLVNGARTGVHCTFVPKSLEYLRAGGRITTATQLGAAVLSLKPSINISGGTLEAGKRYRGSLNRIAFSLMDDFVQANGLKRDFIVIGYSYGVNRTILFALKRHAHKLGFTKSWCFQMGSTVAVHTGEECIGFAGLSSTSGSNKK